MKKALSILFAVLAAILIAFPFVVWWQSPNLAPILAEPILEQYRLTFAEKPYLRLNPFRAKLELKNVTLLTEEQEPILAAKNIVVDFSLRSIFGNTLVVDKIELDGIYVNGEINQGKFSLTGIELPESEPQPAVSDQPRDMRPLRLPYFVATNSLVELNIDGQKVQTKLNRFDLSKTTLDISNQSFTLDFLLRELEIQTLDERNLQFALKKLDVNDLHVDGINQQIHLTSQLNQLHLEEATGYKPLLNINEIKLNQLAYDIGKQQLTLASVIQGLEIGEKASEKQRHLALDEITIEQLILDNANQNLSITTQLEKLNIEEKATGNTVLAFAGLKLPQSQVNWKDTAVSIDTAELTDFQFSKLVEGETKTSGSPLAKIKNLALEKVQLQENHLTADAIVIDSLENALFINQQKQLANLVDLSFDSPTGEEKEPSETSETTTDSDEEKTPATTFHIKEIRITGNSFLDVEDRSVKPRFKQQYKIDRLTINDVNSRDTDMLTKLDLSIHVDQYTKLVSKSEFTLFAEQKNGNINLKTQEVSLPIYSPYMTNQLGIDIKAGQLDIDVNSKIEKNQIKGNMVFNLRGADFSGADEYEKSSLKDQTTIPLNVALGMLKDKHGNIKLSVPMTGSVDDPSFGVRSFVQLAVRKAVLSTSKSYLMKTFVPYANVVSVVQMAGEYALKVRVEDLNYAPGETEIQTEAQQIFAKQFIQLMQDKPKLQLKVCGLGIASEVEKTDLNDEQHLSAVLTLAQQRQEKFKQYILSNSEISSGRLLLCSPEIDRSKKAKPRIEFSI
ncbi:DUF748 domain-containing protein [Teredinibacter sp. KSP-S5-2]|uniref:DUF748 domain-containing protein n=1 Tax=Teredinibacter sp. KSP-S5-2 TaxID=3034506 RepID=UPI0029351EEA|nr:DUF748 domain-containing protein [Teredinibacter sp. KSP-S5-2]WNO08337.1 DUF748 domain-containing protein [Teredinibacter sp. KSP-S5-2]